MTKSGIFARSLLVFFAIFQFSTQLSAQYIPLDGGSADTRQQQSTNADASSVPIFQISTHAVTLDVSVTDKQGTPISGLTKNDFTVLEDGQPQTIANFTAVNMQGNPGQIASGTPPRTIIVFDEVLSSIDDLVSARQELYKFFLRNNGQLAQPTQLYALTANGLLQLHGYTRDGHALTQALHQQKLDISPCNVGRCWFMLPSSSPDVAVSPTEALQEIATSEVPAPTHKTIIWLSSGVPNFTPPDYLPASLQQGIFDDVRGMSDLLRRARITLFTIDIGGVLGMNIAHDQELEEFAAPAMNSSGSTWSDLSPQTLAIQSGGRAIFGRNDTKNLVKECVAQGDVYYSLLYYPTNTDFNGQFRRLIVKIDKPGYTLHTRDGYYAMPNPQMLTENMVQMQLAQAERTHIQYSELPIRFVKTSLASPPSVATIKIYIDTKNVHWQPHADGTMQSTIDVSAVDFSKRGIPLHAASKRVAVTIPMNHGIRARDTLFVAPIELPVTLPDGHLRVIVRDNATGKMGSKNIADLKKIPVHPGTWPALEKR